MAKNGQEWSYKGHLQRDIHFKTEFMTGMNKSSQPTFQDSLIKNSFIGISEKLM